MSKKIRINIKYCPCCGGVPSIGFYHANKPTAEISCMDCGLSVAAESSLNRAEQAEIKKLPPHDAIEKAIQKWNRRVNGNDEQSEIGVENG